MRKTDSYKNLQNSLYSSILPPPETYSPIITGVLDSFSNYLSKRSKESQKLATKIAISLALSLCLISPALADEVPLPKNTDTGAYTLTQITVTDPSNLPVNTITKYEWSETEKKLVPVYYRVNLNKTVYGNPDGDTTLTFGWEKNEKGNLEFKQINPENHQGQTITYKYNPSSYKETITKTIDNGTVTNPSGTSSSNRYQFESGAGLNNAEGSTTSIDNVLYKDNKVTGTLESTTYVSKYAEIRGGVVKNSGTITEITADFINNGIELEAIISSGNILNYVYGGALYSSGEIGDITGDFIGNYASATHPPTPTTTSSVAYGGAIYNSGETGDITGDFIGNYAFATHPTNSTTTSSAAYGGAIYNDGEIGDITGDFIGNYASAYVAYGGAIYNSGEIGDITGDFIGNYISTATNTTISYGGAISNAKGTIGNITGDFIGNYVSTTSTSSAYGGAIHNSGTIGDIKGDFIGNYISASSSVYGGAIYNRGTIGDITGDFIGNYAQGSSAQGGAIFNAGSGISLTATIGDIIGDFIGNYAQGSSAQGGAIFNSVSSYSSTVTIGDITGDFIGNYAQGSSDAYGGAIYNHEGTIGNIAGDFIGNYVSASSTYAYGGAIYNTGTIGDITGSFIGNYAVSESGEALGGAIYTSTDLNIIAKDGGQSVFTGNYTESNGVKTPNAIYIEGAQQLDSEQARFDINGDELIIKVSNATQFPTVTLKAETSGTIQFDDQISGNDTKLQNITYTGTAVMTNFEGKEQIYQMLGLKDDATVSEFLDAYVDYAIEQEFGGQEIPPEYAEQLEQIKAELKQQALGTFISAGYIEIQNPEIVSQETKGSYDLKITGDSTGKVILNNDIINANISLDNTNLYLGREDVFDKSQSLTLNSGSVYMNNDAIGTMHVPTLNLNGNTNLSVDVDLANKSMDRITADNYNIKENAKLNVNNVVLLSDAKQDKTDILFADTPLAGSVAYTGANPVAYSPIWKYDVSYNPEDGFFTFMRGASSSGNPSDNYNPAVLAPNVVQQAGAYTTQLQTFNYAFQHADTFMNIPYMERLSLKNSGKYALSPTGDATDVGTFSPLLTKEENAGFWVKPYASFENIPLKNGPKVSNINYGTLVGYDSNLTPIAHGWERVLTGYIGYNGASQRYSGVDAYQNGGLLGGTATFYKGNFFNATTLSVGATAGDASTMYGSENYTMLLAGIGNKTGYNFEFNDGRIILQPNMLISYTFVNTFDYTNAAGLRINSDPLNAIQLAPGIKLIGNTRNGWQPYLGVNMVWNLLDDSRVTANDVRLPEMSIKPYIQYGAGIQKRFKDRFIAFGQAMIHNGGRNGVSLSGGLRWSVGK